jgi:hypothetical protein
VRVECGFPEKQDWAKGRQLKFAFEGAGSLCFLKYKSFRTFDGLIVIKIKNEL